MTKIICKDCQRDFLFDDREATFFKEKGWDAPIRCKECRQAKKKMREAKDQTAGG